MNAMSMDRTDSRTARRYLALWFPFLPIDRLRIARPDLWAAQGDAPAVVVENVRGAMWLATLDADALAAGMTGNAAAATARLPGPCGLFVIGSRDPITLAQARAARDLRDDRAHDSLPLRVVGAVGADDERPRHRSATARR